jgi:transposase
MIGLPAGTQIWLVAGATDMRKGFDGLSALVQSALSREPFSGQLGLRLDYTRLERGRFVWPQARDGAVHLTPAQLSMLLEGIDWRRPVRTDRPQQAA